MTYAEELSQVEGYSDKLSHAPTAEQGSPQWLAERIGHCTASRFATVLEVTKKGSETSQRRKYRVDLIVERLTGRATEHFVTAAMQDGIDREPMACMAYEARTGAMCEQVGFIHHPTIKYVGGSPDRLVGEDGGVEFKCPTPATHVTTMLTKECLHLPQIQGLMWIKGRQWWDFVSYCPLMPEGLQLYCQRVQRDDDYIAELSANVLNFLAEIEAQHKALMALIP